MRPLASGKALQADSLCLRISSWRADVKFFNTGSQQAAWRRLTDAARVAKHSATNGDTMTTVS